MRATTRPRHSLIAALSFVVLLPGLALAQADQGTQQPVVPAPQVTPAAEPVPVRIGGDPVIFIPVGLGGFSAEQRVANIEETLARVMNDLMRALKAARQTFAFFLLYRSSMPCVIFFILIIVT